MLVEANLSRRIGPGERDTELWHSMAVKLPRARVFVADFLHRLLGRFRTNESHFDCAPDGFAHSPARNSRLAMS